MDNILESYWGKFDPRDRVVWGKPKRASGKPWFAQTRSGERLRWHKKRF